MDVIGIGTPVADFITHMERMPKTNDVVRLLECSWQFGGKVSTAIAALGRLGAQVGMIGVVGADPNGRRCMEDLERHGVDISYMVIDQKGESPFCLVLSEEETHGRSFVGAGNLKRKFEVDDLDRDYITSARFLHLENVTPATIQAASWMKESGGTVVFDADEYNPDVKDMLPLIDVFIASEFYYRGMFKDDDYEKSCRIIREMGPRIAAFTFGEKGCVVMDEKEFFTQDILKVDVKDTTGAGDVFHGAFIFGMLQVGIRVK